MSIKDWNKSERPREKLLERGKESLSDAELLAILIGSGQKNKSAIEIAREIINKSGSLLNLSRKTVNELVKNNDGIGNAKAITIIAALELGRRLSKAKVLDTNKISGSEDIFNFISPHLSDINDEQFWVIYLDNSNKIINHIKISQGGFNSTTVDIRKIFKFAYDNNALKIILTHNHPSMNLNPSDADISLTKSIVNAGSILKIDVLDHIIIGGNNYFSFYDNHLI